MAIELGRFIAEHLKLLPEEHPDRVFIEGMSITVQAYNVKAYGIAKNELPHEVSWDVIRAEEEREIAEWQKQYQLIENRFNQILDDREISVDTKVKNHLIRFVARGVISDFDDLRHISDASLMSKLGTVRPHYYGVGKITLSAIREIFPFQPPIDSTT